MTGFQKRVHDRHTLSLFMEVFEDVKNREPLFKCRTNNIGIGGLMIHNQGQSLHKGSKVKLLLKATCRTGLKEFPVEAKIAWKTSEAIGMQFSPLNEAKQRAFKRFLFESKVAVHSNERKRWQESTSITASLTQSSRNEDRVSRSS